MTELEAIRAEQRAARDLLHAGHPDQRGLRLALNDWFAEEMLLLREADGFGDAEPRP